MSTEREPGVSAETTAAPDAGKPGIGRVVTTADLELLYALIKGVPYANWLMDAAEALGQDDLQRATQRVRDARTRYEKSRARTLRGDQTGAPDPRADKKREKYKRVLDKFDEILAAFERMTRWQESRLEAEAEAQLQVSDALQSELESAGSFEAQLECLRNHYDLRQIESAQEIQPNKLYLVRVKDRAQVLRSLELNVGDDLIAVRSAHTSQQFKPLPRAKLVDLGQRGAAFLLSPAQRPSVRLQKEPDAGNSVDSPREGTGRLEAREVLNMGEFSQLMDAARRSGLVPNADVIAHVRDREFRMGKYQQASQVIEDLFGKFMASAGQRMQRLRREELDIASGKIKMSPKELLAKRAKDTAETQLVDRARNRFQRVMEGLRILMNS